MAVVAVDSGAAAVTLLLDHVLMLPTGQASGRQLQYCFQLLALRLAVPLLGLSGVDSVDTAGVHLQPGGTPAIAGLVAVCWGCHVSKDKEWARVLALDAATAWVGAVSSSLPQAVQARLWAGGLTRQPPAKLVRCAQEYGYSIDAHATATDVLCLLLRHGVEAADVASDERRVVCCQCVRVGWWRKRSVSVSLCLSLCLSVSLSLCLCLFTFLSVCLSACLSVCLSVGLPVSLCLSLSGCPSVGLPVCRSALSLSAFQFARTTEVMVWRGRCVHAGADEVHSHSG